jgi:hypothetical protein
LARTPCLRAQIRRGLQTLAAEELRSKLREGKAETWAYYGVARRTKSEVKKLQATEPLDGTTTGTAKKTVENQRPEKIETPHLRSTIKLKSKEGNITDRCKIQFFIELKQESLQSRRSPPSLLLLIETKT